MASSKVASDKVIEELMKAKQIVVICGAGISVAAGIPSFRGKGGLYSSKAFLPQSAEVNIIDLFSRPKLQNDTILRLHCQLIASLAKESILADPTTFHHFLRALDNRGSLLRVYTQNIDGLELKAGLHTSIELDLNEDPPVRCIPLHGMLDELRCSSCSSIFKLEAYYQCLKDGQFPECSQCQEKMDERVKQGKRLIRVPCLRSNIVLYDEDHPYGDEIAEAQKNDIPQVDFLLVVGTSLTVNGTAKLIRQFSKALQVKFPNKNLESPHVVFLNYTFPNSSVWKDVFDGWVETDCEEFAKRGLAKAEKEWSDKHDGSEAKGFLYADRCLDSRPSWRL